MLRPFVTATFLALSPAAAAQTANAVPCNGRDHALFDFWIGDWVVKWSSAQIGKSGIAHSHVERIVDGCGIRETFDDSVAKFSETSILALGQFDHLWRQLEVDNGGGSYIARGGSMPNGTIVLNLDGRGSKGPGFRVLFEKIQADSFVWRFQTKAGNAPDWRDLTGSDYRRARPGANKHSPT